MTFEKVCSQIIFYKLIISFEFCAWLTDYNTTFWVEISDAEWIQFLGGLGNGKIADGNGDRKPPF